MAEIVATTHTTIALLFKSTPNNEENYKNTIGDKYKKTPHLFPQFSLPLHTHNYTL